MKFVAVVIRESTSWKQCAKEVLGIQEKERGLRDLVWAFNVVEARGTSMVLV
jgi:hypothetical protein